MIEKIRRSVVEYLDIPCIFKLSGSRNQIEEFVGRIVHVYPFIFTVFSIDDKTIKSFAYTDILIGVLEIKKITL